MRAVIDTSVRPLKPVHRALSGRVALRSGGHASHESSLERDWLMVLDFDWRARRIQEQPFTLDYEMDGRMWPYTPDVQVDFNDYRRQWTVVYEVKQIEDLRANWKEFRPRFKAALRYCRSQGWSFKLITERDLRTAYVNNIKFLRRYRAMPLVELHREALMYTMKGLGETTVEALLTAVWWNADHRAAAIPSLWQLVAERKISTSLVDPMTMRSIIWSAR